VKSPDFNAFMMEIAEETASRSGSVQRALQMIPKSIYQEKPFPDRDADYLIEIDCSIAEKARVFDYIAFRFIAAQGKSTSRQVPSAKCAAAMRSTSSMAASQLCSSSR
jgi:hypothetical protein